MSRVRRDQDVSENEEKESTSFLKKSQKQAQMHLQPPVTASMFQIQRNKQKASSSGGMYDIAV